MKARFRCDKITMHSYAGTEILLTAVASDDPDSENYGFWRATPSGQLTMTVDNAPAAAFFRVNHVYEMEFTDLGESN